MQHRQACVLMVCLCDSMQFNGHGATGVLEPDGAHVQGVGDAHVWLLPPHGTHGSKYGRANTSIEG